MLLSAIFQIQFVRSPVNLFIYHATIAWFYFYKNPAPLTRGAGCFYEFLVEFLAIVPFRNTGCYVTGK